MGEWRECRLYDIAELSKATWKVGDEWQPYIGLEHIEEGKLRLKSIGNSDEVRSNKLRFDENCFLFGKLRPYFRKLFRPKFSGICSTDIWVVKTKKNWDLDFLFYFFANKEFVDLSYTGSSGTRMPRADWNHLKDIIWNVPSNSDEQKAIAEVLTSLDDKIDLLHRQNKTLETLAETLFRQWFIEEVNDKWNEESLDKIASYLNGLACQKYLPENQGKSRLPVLKIKDLRGGISNSSDWATSNVPAEYIVQNGDIIFSWSGSLLVKIWDGSECVLNQHLFKVTSNRFQKWFYYHWTKYYLDNFIAIAETKATTMGHIKRSDLSEAMVIVPDNES